MTMQLPNWQIIVYFFNALLTMAGILEVAFCIYYRINGWPILGCFLIGCGLGLSLFLVDCTLSQNQNSDQEFFGV